MTPLIDPDFPCAFSDSNQRGPTLFLSRNRIVEVPFPTSRLASTALQALQVDKELSALVSRSFALASPPSPPLLPSHDVNTAEVDASSEAQSILRVEYKATTNRMLRVAVNSFMESLSLIIEVMGELDEDVLAAASATASDDKEAY